jgi:hypothetical protein
MSIGVLRDKTTKLLDRLPTLRTIVAALGIGIVAAAGVFCSGLLLYGWVPGPIQQYELSEAKAGLIGQWSLLVGAAILILMAAVDYRGYFISVPVVVSPLLFTVFYECEKNPTSHNLLPIEIAAWIGLSIVVHVPSMAARTFHKWASTFMNSGMWDRRS